VTKTTPQGDTDEWRFCVLSIYKKKSFFILCLYLFF